jgi:hypothetical protein
LERLQAEVPGSYPEGLLRTVQRRVKTWRAELAREMVFGRGGDAASRQQVGEATGGEHAATELEA